MNNLNQDVEVTALYFRNKPAQHQLESFPRRMVWGEREYNFIESGMRYLVQKGQQLIQLFDMTDGQQTYRLRLENDHWTLVGTKAGA